MSSPAVLTVRGLCVRDSRDRSILDNFDLTLRAGEVTALVGETGSGKTTVLNSMLGLLPPGLTVGGGEVRIADGEGINLLDLNDAERRRYLGLEIGYVPQDVRSGLNPLMTVRAVVMEAARRGDGKPGPRADAAMRRAGLTDAFLQDDANRRPGRLSGGQCQRVLIAQAIVNQPRLLLLDEPTAALDPPTRLEVWGTIQKIKRDGCSVCLVTHDVASLAGLADTIGVMYLGRIVELGPAEEVLRRPRHPYTIGLLGCVPRLDRLAPVLPIAGNPPSGAADVAGCGFHPRCSWCEDVCRTTGPHLQVRGLENRAVACHVVVGEGR